MGTTQRKANLLPMKRQEGGWKCVANRFDFSSFHGGHDVIMLRERDVSKEQKMKPEEITNTEPEMRRQMPEQPKGAAYQH